MGLNRYPSAKRRMRALGVVEVDPFANACARGGAGLEGTQIEALIFQRPP